MERTLGRRYTVRLACRGRAGCAVGVGHPCLARGTEGDIITVTGWTPKKDIFENDTTLAASAEIDHDRGIRVNLRWYCAAGTVGLDIGVEGHTLDTHPVSRVRTYGEMNSVRDKHGEFVAQEKDLTIEIRGIDTNYKGTYIKTLQDDHHVYLDNQYGLAEIWNNEGHFLIGGFGVNGRDVVLQVSLRDPAIQKFFSPPSCESDLSPIQQLLPQNRLRAKARNNRV